jgi:hypothetical protein
MAVTSDITRSMLGYLEDALDAARVFAAFRVWGGNKNWAMYTEKRGAEYTGNIIVTCDDTEAMLEFTDIVQQKGHSVETGETDQIIVITPDGADDICPLMCPGCPLIPGGVQAKLTNAQTITASGLRRFKIFVDLPEFTAHWAGRLHITCRITSSRDRAQIGSTGTMMVRDPGCGAAGVARLVKQCRGPKHFSSWRWLAIRARVCGCLGPQFRKDI